MDKIKNVPAVLRLHDDDVFHLSILHAWMGAFPPKLRRHARINLHQLHRATQAGEISAYGLLCGAYIGFSPLPVNYGRFTIEADRINKREPNPPAFRKDVVARENSAANEFEMSRGELKRLLSHLDDFAMKFAGIASFAAVFNCNDEILNDPSPYAPAGRETYAKGPLHLWDFAKAAEEHKLFDMCFGTFDDWVLFLHLDNNVVAGHAIHASAHRFGNFLENSLIDAFSLLMSGNIPSPIIEVPVTVQEAVEALAEDRFPGRPFEFIPPPMVWNGAVIPSKRVPPSYRNRTEA